MDGGTTYDVIQASATPPGLSNDSNTAPPRRADIINLSLGSNFSSQTEQNTIDQARNAGVIVIAAAGNDASSNPSFPAAYTGVVSVAATTITRTHASYSNFGPTIDVAAPGGNSATDVNGDGIGDGVVSTFGDDAHAPVTFGYAALTGTSMATPHVAGVAALMKSVYPGLTPAQFDDALAAGLLTDDLGAPGRDDQFGNGLINAQKAVNAAVALASGAGTPVDPVLAVSPASINFGAFETTFDVELRNAGGGSISIVTASSNQPWLQAAPLNVDANGLGTYRLTVDRTLVSSDGTYTGTISVTSTANPIDIGVVMQRFTVSPSANAGLHYVLLIDVVSDLVANSAVVERGRRRIHLHVQRRRRRAVLDLCRQRLRQRRVDLRSRRSLRRIPHARCARSAQHQLRPHQSRFHQRIPGQFVQLERRRRRPSRSRPIDISNIPVTPSKEARTP